jgi:hypothetical protein
MATYRFFKDGIDYMFFSLHIIGIVFCFSCKIFVLWLRLEVITVHCFYLYQYKNYLNSLITLVVSSGCNNNALTCLKLNFLSKDHLTVSKLLPKFLVILLKSEEAVEVSEHAVPTCPIHVQWD